MSARDARVLALIRLAQEKQKGSRMLPVMEKEGELYFVDERLGELRHVSRPWESRPIPVEWWFIKAERILEEEGSE